MAAIRHRPRIMSNALEKKQKNFYQVGGEEKPAEKSLPTGGGRKNTTVMQVLQRYGTFFEGTWELDGRLQGKTKK